MSWKSAFSGPLSNRMKCDPDNRQDRTNSEVVTYKLPPEELQKQYSNIKSYKKPSMQGVKYINQNKAETEKLKEIKKEVALDNLHDTSSKSKTVGRTMKLTHVNVMLLLEQGKSKNDIFEYYKKSWRNSDNLLKAQIGNLSKPPKHKGVEKPATPIKTSEKERVNMNKYIDMINSEVEILKNKMAEEKTELNARNSIRLESINTLIGIKLRMEHDYKVQHDNT